MNKQKAYLDIAAEYATMMNEFDERYVQKILALHDEMGLDPGDDPETRLWHVLRAILEFCDGNGISLDVLVADVKDDFLANHAIAAT